MRPIRDELAVFETVVFDGAPGTKAEFNETFRIPYEGVYSTYFLFGKHKVVENTATVGEDKASDDSQNKDQK